MLNILILGGTGFIGKNIIDFYENNSNVNLFILTRSKTDNYKSELKNINYFEGQLDNLELLQQQILSNRINKIVHLVSDLVPSSTTEDYYKSISNIIIPTYKIIDFIAGMDITFYFFSSGGTIYGKSNETLTETNDLKPINNYGYSKLMIENYLKFKSNQSNLKYVILRPSNVYGKHQRFEGNQGFIPIVIKKIFNESEITIWGDGNIVRDYINIEQVTFILDRLLKSTISNEVFNVSSALGYTLLEVINIIESNLNKKAKIKFEPKRAIDAEKVILDNSKIIAIFGKKNLSIEQGIKNQVLDFLSIV